LDHFARLVGCVILKHCITLTVQLGNLLEQEL